MSKKIYALLDTDDEDDALKEIERLHQEQINYHAIINFIRLGVMNTQGVDHDGSMVLTALNTIADKSNAFTALDDFIHGKAFTRHHLTDESVKIVQALRKAAVEPPNSDILETLRAEHSQTDINYQAIVSSANGVKIDISKIDGYCKELIAKISKAYIDADSLIRLQSYIKDANTCPPTDVRIAESVTIITNMRNINRSQDFAADLEETLDEYDTAIRDMANKLGLPMIELGAPVTDYCKMAAERLSISRSVLNALELHMCGSAFDLARELLR